MKVLFFLLWRCDPTLVMASSFLRFLDHTQRRSTVGRTPLDELLACRRALYLTTHNTHNRQTSMPRWVSNPRSQQVSSRRPTPQTARPLGPAYSLSYDWFIASSKLNSSQIAVQCFLFQFSISFVFLKVIQYLLASSSSSRHFYPSLYFTFNDVFYKAVSKQCVTNRFTLPSFYCTQDIPLHLHSMYNFLLLYNKNVVSLPIFHSTQPRKGYKRALLAAHSSAHNSFLAHFLIQQNKDQSMEMSSRFLVLCIFLSPTLVLHIHSHFIFRPTFASYRTRVFFFHAEQGK